MTAALPDRISKTLVAVWITAAGLLASSNPLPALETDSAATADPSDPSAAITVGPRSAVGKPETASRVVGGLLGGVLGGSKDRGERPRTRRDPTRKLDYTPFEASAFDLETGARAAWQDESLLVSTRIEDADDKGTFQAIFLQSCDGRRLYPEAYEIYKLWSEGSLSVSWSRSSSVNGQVVNRDSGGWDDRWSDGFNVPGDDLAVVPGTWRQLGFERAYGGARQLGARFRLTPSDLEALGPLTLYAHSTLPAREPVTTVASRWLLQPGDDGAVDILPPGETDGSSPCPSAAPVLVAAAGSGIAVLAATGSARLPAARRGYSLPEGLVVTAARGTGRTTGHIADLNVRNDSDAPVTLPATAFYIPSTHRFQSYIGAPRPGSVVPPGATVAVPIDGYCGDVRRPPVPAGEALPPVDEWVTPDDTADPVVIAPADGAAPPPGIRVPGTDQPLPRPVDPDTEPLLAAPLLIAAVGAIERATADLQESGALTTPFSGNPEREHEAVAQQTLWRFAAGMKGEPYTREEFTERLEAQYEQNTGTPITAAPPEDRERVQQGADDFWGAFDLVGVEAKVFSHPEATGQEPVADTEDEPVPPAETLGPGCTPDEHFEHTPQTVDVVVDDAYGNEDDRDKIRTGIRKAVEEASEAYATSTPPSTAYSIWGHDHIGGFSSAYAKSVFLEESRQEWVWWTDPISTSSSGTGIHTLSFEHGEECKSVVGGAALMWIKAASDAFDPLENNIEYFRALDAVKEANIEYLADKLPAGLGEALEAGVDAITDPSSDTYARASGTATVTVGGDSDDGSTENRVVYKREDKEDSAIIGGGETIGKLLASDHRPGSLTSKIDAAAELEAGAEGNGFAKAWLESLYGTLLIGVCECPTHTSYKVSFDNGQFIRSEGAAEAVKRAIREMNEAAERIGKDIESGDQETTGDALEERARVELEAWGDSIGGDRFEADDTDQD
ncbi:hypothetical protein [Elongatibacter sediminis]|uniref:Uncharacterized protein n=1 Tax=Elongatibacter sediminis TaxID=3119006 RepID=A0AAW9RB56_9GAMM